MRAVEAGCSYAAGARSPKAIGEGQREHAPGRAICGLWIVTSISSALPLCGSRPRELTPHHGYLHHHVYALLCIYMMMQADAFLTLADPTRRRVVAALRHGERQVNDIVQEAGIHQSGVSRHLRILHEAGFVAVRPVGQRRLYSLRPDRFRELDAWLSDYRGLWEARLDRFGAALETRQQLRKVRDKVRNKE